MSTLTSASTDAEVEAAYDTNASYMEDHSHTKAKAYVTAIRILLRRAPTDVAKGLASARWNRFSLENELKRTIDWLEAHDPSFRPGPIWTEADVRQLRE